MNREEHLMTIAMEECCEVAQRVSKANRFGMSEVQPEQALTNRERISEEFADLIGVLEMLGVDTDSPWVRSHADSKKAKVEHFLKYSEACGTLAPTSSQRKAARA